MISRWIRDIRRVSRMGQAEIIDRSRQRISAFADSWRARFGAEFVAPMALSNLTLGRFYFTQAEINSLIGAIRTRWPDTANRIVRRAELACDHRFDLLGYEQLDYGREIDWHCDLVHGKRAPRVPFYKVPYLDFDVVGDSKITWELNRHQHFVTLAKAWRLTGDDRFVHEIFAQFEHWRESNPYPFGINWASSLEVAIRSVSWTWTWFLLADTPLFSSDLRREWIRGLQLSARHIESHLSTYFSPNTHLLGECAALFTLGTMFPSLAGASRWSDAAWESLWRSAHDQVLGNGLHFERSTYYHVYALDMLLHCRILAHRNDIAVPAEADQLLTRMLNALIVLGTGGQAHTLGDDDGGRWFDASRNRAEHMLDPLAIGTSFFKHDYLKAARVHFTEESVWLLGMKGLAESNEAPTRNLPEALDVPSESRLSLVSRPNHKSQTMIAEGPMGRGTGGHAHADLLSIQLVQSGRPLLIDCGTFQYTRQNGERDRLRSTSAHNTMTVDGQDQAQSTGAFSWESLPAAIVEQSIAPASFDLFVGSHNGYTRLPEPVTHRRLVFSPLENFRFVLDRAEGVGTHNLRVRWHLAPSLVPTPADPRVFAAESQYFALIPALDDRWIERRLSVKWSPVYGKLEDCTVLEFERDGQVPAELATILVADVGDVRDIGTLERFSAGSDVSAYCYRNHQTEHLFFVPGGPAAWRCRNWASDASFVYAVFEHSTGKVEVIFCHGSHVDLDGKRILSSGGLVRFARGRGKPDEIILLESEPEDTV